MIQTELELNKLLTEHGYDTSAECVQRAITHYVGGKWLLLHGGVGTGKTQFFRTIAEFSDVPIVICGMDEIASWNADDLLEHAMQWKNTELVIDDLGRECKATTYGSAYNPLLMLLDYRLNLKVRTHITTNFKGGDFTARYENRILDRLKAFKGIKFDGGSRRSERVTLPEGPDPSQGQAEAWIKNHFAKVQRNYAINTTEEYLNRCEGVSYEDPQMREKAIERLDELGIMEILRRKTRLDPDHTSPYSLHARIEAWLEKLGVRD